MKPNYKLPSFRLGFMEVVTVAAHAVTASFCSIKMNSLLKAISKCIAPGWTNTFNVSFNNAFSQNFVIGRMVYEIAQVKKLFLFFLVKQCKTHSLRLSLLHNPILPRRLPQFCPMLSLRNLFSARLLTLFTSKVWHKSCSIYK